MVNEKKEKDTGGNFEQDLAGENDDKARGNSKEAIIFLNTEKQSRNYNFLEEKGGSRTGF